MPTENEKTENLVDVGEADQQETEVNLDDKGEPEKVETVKEEIEVEQVPEDKSFENERETKLEENKDELKEYSDGVQKRIAKLTRKMREAERQKEEAVAYAQSIKYKNDEMEGRISKMDTSYVSEFESRVKTGLAAAKLALKNAIESQDVEAQIAAQQQLAALTMDEARVNSLKVANENKPQPQQREVNITPQQRAPQQQSDPRAEDWASKNDWFGKDNVMTAAALAIDAELKGEGYDPQDQDFYQEIDNRLKKAFPQKLGESQERVQEVTSSPAQVVSGGSRSSSSSSRKVKLSKEDVALAQKWNIPLEKYAAEKLKVDDSDGYTNIL